MLSNNNRIRMKRRAPLIGRQFFNFFIMMSDNITEGQQNNITLAL